MSVMIATWSGGDFHESFADGEVSLLTVRGDDHFAWHELR